MNKELGIDDFTYSQRAVKNYIDFRNENSFQHKAIVIISSKGKTLFNNIILVNISIDTNYSYACLVGNEQFDRDFYSKYINKYQKFKFINGTLLIQAEDRWGKAIEIDITGV
jgi:hypothetical protein